MKKYERLLRKISKDDREKIMLAVALLQANQFDLLKVEKLTGYDTYRVRVGKYRIKFKKLGKVSEILSIERRSDTTYNNLFI